MNLSRRGFIGGLGLAIAAPAIVKAASLMPVSSRYSKAKYDWKVLTVYGRTTFVVPNMSFAPIHLWEVPSPPPVPGDILSIQRLLQMPVQVDGARLLLTESNE
jgi:hypothetical protein